MTDRNGNLNENSRSGSREDGREPVRRNTAMNSREIMLEDEDYLDEPDEGYLDDDYFDRDMEERILREAELDMENIHQPERQDQNRWEEPERLPDDDVMLLLKLIFHRQDSQSKAQPRPWKSERGYRAGGSPCGAAAGTGFRKDGILDGNHPGKGSSES